MRKIVLLFILVSGYAFSQNVNDYQYVIVPVKYGFLKKDDQYRLNSLTKLMLQKYGFKAYLSSEEIPSEVVGSDRCDFLYADVIENNGMLLTKVKIVLKDCKENVIYETQLGSSREKEYDVAYNQALREAGASFDKLKYKYSGKIGFTSVDAGKKAETMTSNTSDALTEASSLFAKPFENGFQLMTNNTAVPRYVMTIYKTSSPDCYLINDGVSNGVLLRNSGKWYIEYYKGNQLVSQTITIVNLN